MQRSSLVALQTSLLQTVEGKGPLSKSDISALDANFDAVISDCHIFSVSLSLTKEFLMNLGSFVTSRIALLDEQVVEQLVKDITKLYLSTAADVTKIVAEQDEANESYDMSLPPVVPSQLIKMSHLEFCNVVATQQERMTIAGWTAADADAMEEEHRDLVQAAAAKLALQGALDACKDGVLNKSYHD